ncbi:MAG: aminoglycoside phosphotransferase family protein [Terracoccus sp.]
MTDALGSLTIDQRRLLALWLPGAEVVRDHGWGLVATTVLEIVSGGARFIVKAGGPDDTHIAREVHAHRHWLRPWTDVGRAPLLELADAEAKVLVTRFLPGELVLGTGAADDPDTYRQAGELLSALHGQTRELDDAHEQRENDKALAWLSGPHRIAPDVAGRLRDEISGWETPPTVTVPTHGDWQPRNWLAHDGEVRVIDLGRAALRPAMTDLTRLAAQDFRRDPTLEAAFLDGYGSDPREPEAWHRTRVREAIGTAAWAHRVGDEAFEAQGHRMIADALR